jgi:hypothetical protein
MYQLKIIKGKHHHILHEMNDRNEYIISYDNDVYFWRPNLEMIGSDYMNLSDVIKMINKLESDKRKWRSIANISGEERKSNLINFWKEIYQIMRGFRIEKVLEPQIDYNCYILAC